MNQLMVGLPVARGVSPRIVHPSPNDLNGFVVAARPQQLYLSIHYLALVLWFVQFVGDEPSSESERS